MDCFIPLLRNPDREWVCPAAAATAAGVARSDGAKPPSPHLPGTILMKPSHFFSSFREISL